ncbi:unnamed protein product [Nippostrongylus brasiliensis]|uniref:BPI2 domain-containing protein n=1 Tax=Nippostrongylus brasiliensis TaxID=27835 RepID=A0A0N4Y428_NIPBR|nr:unnamed protein product [Nippostrongylus brasiliensis]
MITVWMSESVPNCLLTSAHEGKLVQFTVTKDVQDIASYLKTNCSFFSICIGRFFPKLKTDYPDQYIDLHFHTYVAPFIQMQDVLESQSTVIPEMVNKRLGGSLNETDVQIWQDFSDIGDMSNTFLTVFDKVFTATARLMIGTLLQKGVPLPIFDNVTLADDSEIHVFEKHVRLNADFEFE